MAGPASDFEELFRTEYRTIVRTVLAIVGDRGEAEAVTQDAFVKAMARWRRVRRLDRPGAWVRRVAIRDAVRLAARRSELGADVPQGQLAGADHGVDGMDLHAALATLSLNQRTAVVLHHLAGWPVAEVADVLGCADATVRVHLHRGRTNLAERLHEEVTDGRG